MWYKNEHHGNLIDKVELLKVSWLTAAAGFPLILLLGLLLLTNTHTPSTSAVALAVPILSGGSLTIQIQAEPAVVATGDIVTFTYSVANNNPNFAITNLTVVDSEFGTLPFSSSLPPDSSEDYVTTSQVTTTVSHQVQASGYLMGIIPVNANDSATVTVVTPGLSLFKSVEPAYVLAGESVIYSFLVENTGDTPLINLLIQDDMIQAPCPITMLNPGEQTNCVSEAVIINQTTTNTATAEALFLNDRPISSVPSSAVVTVINPQLSLVKSVDLDTVPSGETVVYSFKVQNIGDILLTNLTIQDDVIQEPISCPDRELDPGEETICISEPVTINQTTINTAVAQADALGIYSVTSNQDSATVTLATLNLSLQKTVEPSYVFAGEEVTYSFAVQNQSNVRVTDLEIEDNLLTVPVVCPITELDPGEQTTCVTGPVIIQQTITNEAKAVARFWLWDVESDLEQATVTVISPNLQLSKQISMEQILPGELGVIYTFGITNSGMYPIEQLQIVDPLLADAGIQIECLQTQLSPNESTTCTSQLYIANQMTVNTAIAEAVDSMTGNSITSNQATATVNFLYLPLVQYSFPSWQQVGNMPESVLKFYDVSVCNGQYLSGTDIGAYLGSGSDWQPVVPIPIGVVFQVDFTSDCNTAYVATHEDGVYRGRKNGNSWQWTQVYPAGEAIRALDIREAVDTVTIFIGGDFGVKWAINEENLTTNDWDDTSINTLVTGLTLRSDTNHLYAAIWNVGYAINNTLGDNATWHVQPDVPGSPLIYQVAESQQGRIAATQSGVYYWDHDSWQKTDLPEQTSYAVTATSTALYAGQRYDGGVFISLDGGKNWAEIMAGMNKDSPFGELQVWNLPIEDGKLYAATTSGVWRWSGTP